MQLERVMSIMRYWAGKGTAGLARSRVRGKRRSPAPPASKTPSVSLIGHKLRHCVLARRTNHMTQMHNVLRWNGETRVYHAGMNFWELGWRQGRQARQNAARACFLEGGDPLGLGCVGRGLFGETNAERLQKGEVVAGERAVGIVFRGRFSWLGGFRLDLVETDGCLEHEQDIKTLFANVFDHACDVLGLRDGFVNGFAKFLDKVFYLLIQCHLRDCPMVRTFTTHRVFPAQSTGGNGIAGT